MSHPKHARPDHEILDVIRQRWSPRAFDGARSIARADLMRLFEAARWAASAGNEQPWRFVLTDRDRSPEARLRLFDALTPKNQAWAAAAPALVLVAVRETREMVDAVNTHAWYDAGQAVAMLTLQATSMGLGVRQMQGFSSPRVAEALAVPVPYTPAVVMALGYPGDPEVLSIDAHRAAETQPRSRRAIGEFVFEGVFGQPLGA